MPTKKRSPNGRKPPENRKKTAKPRGRPWPAGVSGNPGGRPKITDNSITYWLRLYLGMSPSQVADAAETFAKELRKFKTPMPTAAVIAVNAVNALMNDPDPRLLAHVLDRTDGKLTNTLAV